jgi:hypothetical protein
MIHAAPLRLDSPPLATRPQRGQAKRRPCVAEAAE